MFVEPMRSLNSTVRRRRSPLGSGGLEGRGPRARVPDSCRFEASRPYHFRARIKSFQGVGAPFAVDSVVPSASRAAISATATPRLERSTIGSAAASSETAAQEPTQIEIPSAFCDFSRLCKAENFPPVATRLPSSARPALGHGGKQCLRPSRPRRSLASSHARAVPSSPRSQCCRRSSAGSRGAKGETGRFQTLTLIRFSRKKIRQKSNRPKLAAPLPRPCRKTRRKKERQVDYGTRFEPSIQSSRRSGMDIAQTCGYAPYIKQRS